jgi:hypothetical protein
MSYNRKNFIDGLPNSYDFNYVLKTNKKCSLCQKKISQSDIESNFILCTEDFDFIHKECVNKNDYEIIHNNPKDLSSMIRLKKISVNLPELEKNTDKISLWL